MHPATVRPRRGESHEIDDVSRWLVDRDAICADEVVEWMVQGTSLSTSELASRWADRDWAWALSDLIVEAVDDDDAAADANLPIRGFLRGVSAGRGVGILGLDGTTQWLHHRRWKISHPAQLESRQAWEALAAEAGIQQHIDQLGRAVFVRDRSLHADGDTAAIVAPSPATAAGSDAAGEPAPSKPAPSETAPSETTRTDPLTRIEPTRTDPVTRIETFWQDGAWLEAHIADTAAGRRLSFHDEDGRAVPLAAVGPVAWSEAVRLAA